MVASRELLRRDETRRDGVHQYRMPGLPGRHRGRRAAGNGVLSRVRLTGPRSLCMMIFPDISKFRQMLESPGPSRLDFKKIPVIPCQLRRRDKAHRRRSLLLPVYKQPIDGRSFSVPAGLTGDTLRFVEDPYNFPHAAPSSNSASRARRLKSAMTLPDSSRQASACL